MDTEKEHFRIYSQSQLTKYSSVKNQFGEVAWNNQLVWVDLKKLQLILNHFSANLPDEENKNLAD